MCYLDDESLENGREGGRIVIEELAQVVSRVEPKPIPIGLEELLDGQLSSHGYTFLCQI